MTDQSASPESIATQIEELDKRASLEPWDVRAHLVWNGIDDDATEEPQLAVRSNPICSHDDIAFINAIRTLAPLMAAEWRKSQARIKELEPRLLAGEIVEPES